MNIDQPRPARRFPVPGIIAGAVVLSAAAWQGMNAFRASRSRELETEQRTVLAKTVADCEATEKSLADQLNELRQESDRLDDAPLKERIGMLQRQMSDQSDVTEAGRLRRRRFAVELDMTRNESARLVEKKSALKSVAEGVERSLQATRQLREQSEARLKRLGD